MLACGHEDVVPDGLILGKALGGGILAVSMFLAKKEIMDIFVPGTHGSTFGGNPLAAAVGTEALNILLEDKLPERSMEMGDYLTEELGKRKSPLISSIRGKGLFIGIEVKEGNAMDFCQKLLKLGLVVNDSHGHTIRISPPLVINEEEMDFMISRLEKVLLG